MLVFLCGGYGSEKSYLMPLSLEANRSRCYRLAIGVVEI